MVMKNQYQTLALDFPKMRSNSIANYVRLPDIKWLHWNTISPERLPVFFALEKLRSQRFLQFRSSAQHQLQNAGCTVWPGMFFSPGLGMSFWKLNAFGLAIPTRRKWLVNPLKNDLHLKWLVFLVRSDPSAVSRSFFSGLCHRVCLCTNLREVLILL